LPRLDLTALYEQLRRRVLDGGRSVPGCALLQHHGMRSWIESCVRAWRPHLRMRPAHVPATAHVPPCGDLLHIITAMVLEIHYQGAIL
jgi:hypothetical protein